MNKNCRIIDDININSKLKDIINKTFYTKYDHSWIKYIYINSNIINYQYYYIYFKNQFIKTINKDDLYNEKLLIILIDDIIDSIKRNQIKLTIYHLPDILRTNENYQILYSNQQSIKELNNFKDNNDVYIKYISKKLLQIDFSIEHQNVNFYIKHTKFFECNVDDIDKYIGNTENTDLLNKYRKLEKDKIKIYFKGNFKLYYDNRFIKYIFSKGYWIDFCHSIGNEDEFNDINFKDDYYSYCYYDIIIYDSSVGKHIFKYLNNWIEKELYCNIEMMKNKMFIILRTILNFDLSKEEYNYQCFPIDTNKFIYYSKPNILTNNIILKTSLRPYNNNGTCPNYNIEPKQMYNLEKKCEFCDLGVLTHSFNNFTCLNKTDFFKNYNLDPTKKLVTIFLTWPTLVEEWFVINNIDIDLTVRNKFEIDMIKTNKFLLDICESFSKQNCNIVFKLHPREGICCFPFKDINIDVNLDDRNKNIYLLEEMIFLNKKTIFVDNSYTPEISKHTDYCVFLSGTSVGYFNYLYDIPALCISTKNKECDWFRSIALFLKEYYYGIFVYYEDIIDNLDYEIEQFLNIDHKKNYKYFNDHPLYGNSYMCNYEKLGDKIIDLIKSNSNLKISNTDIKLLKDPTQITIYDNKNIKMVMKKDEIILEIINIPNKNYGISIKVFENNYNYTYKLLCDCRIDVAEKDIALRIYTGKKWINTTEIVTTTYKQFQIIDDFNFYSNSKWRISTTSLKINQKIFIKNIFVSVI